MEYTRPCTVRVRTRVYEWLSGVFVFGEIWRDVPQYKMKM